MQPRQTASATIHAAGKGSGVFLTLLSAIPHASLTPSVAGPAYLAGDDEPLAAEEVFMNVSPMNRPSALPPAAAPFAAFVLAASDV